MREKGKCEWCGEPCKDAHHMVARRRSIFLRHRLENGVALCAKCHFNFHDKEAHTGWTLFEIQRPLDFAFVLRYKDKVIPIKDHELAERLENWGTNGGEDAS